MQSSPTNIADDDLWYLQDLSLLIEIVPPPPIVLHSSIPLPLSKDGTKASPLSRNLNFLLLQWLTISHIVICASFFIYYAVIKRNRKNYQKFHGIRQRKKSGPVVLIKKIWKLGTETCLKEKVRRDVEQRLQFGSAIDDAPGSSNTSNVIDPANSFLCSAEVTSLTTPVPLNLNTPYSKDAIVSRTKRLHQRKNKDKSENKIDEEKDNVRLGSRKENTRFSDDGCYSNMRLGEESSEEEEEEDDYEHSSLTSSDVTREPLQFENDAPMTAGREDGIPNSQIPSFLSQPLPPSHHLSPYYFYNKNDALPSHPHQSYSSSVSFLSLLQSAILGRIAYVLLSFGADVFNEGQNQKGAEENYFFTASSGNISSRSSSWTVFGRAIKVLIRNSCCPQEEGSLSPSCPLQISYISSSWSSPNNIIINSNNNPTTPPLPSNPSLFTVSSLLSPSFLLSSLVHTSIPFVKAALSQSITSYYTTLLPITPSPPPTSNNQDEASAQPLSFLSVISCLLSSPLLPVIIILIPFLSILHKIASVLHLPQKGHHIINICAVVLLLFIKGLEELESWERERTDAIRQRLGCESGEGGVDQEEGKNNSDDVQLASSYPFSTLLLEYAVGSITFSRNSNRGKGWLRLVLVISLLYVLIKGGEIIRAYVLGERYRKIRMRTISKTATVEYRSNNKNKKYDDNQQRRLKRASTSSSINQSSSPIVYNTSAKYTNNRIMIRQFSEQQDVQQHNTEVPWKWGWAWIALAFVWGGCG